MWKAQVPFLARHHRRHHDRPARQRPLGPARPTPPRTDFGSSSATRSPSWTPPTSSGRSGRPLPAAPRGRCGTPPTTRPACWAGSPSARGHRDVLEPNPPKLAAFERFDEQLDDDEGWAQVQPSTTGCATVDGSSSSSSARCCPSRTRPRWSRTRSAGGWTPTPRPLIATWDSRRDPATTAAGRGRCCARSAARSWSSTATRTRCQPHARGAAAGRADRRHAWSRSTVPGHLPMARDPVAGQPAASASSRSRCTGDRRAPVAPGGGRWTGRRRALFLSSPIGLGHARRDLAIVGELRERRPGSRRSSG